MWKLGLVVVVVLSSASGLQYGLREDRLCDGNRFLFLSTYVLGRQEDLTNTTNNISKSAVIEKVEYQD